MFCLCHLCHPPALFVGSDVLGGWPFFLGRKLTAVQGPALRVGSLALWRGSGSQACFLYASGLPPPQPWHWPVKHLGPWVFPNGTGQVSSAFLFLGASTTISWLIFFLSCSFIVLTIGKYGDMTDSKNRQFSWLMLLNVFLLEITCVEQEISDAPLP